ASRQSLWQPTHAVGLLAGTLTLLGLAGLAARCGPRFGRLGATGTILAVIGLVATAAVGAVEAFVFPVLARRDPQLLDLDGPILSSSGFRMVAGLALLWFVGLTLVGLAVERTRVLPRGVGALLAAGAVAFAAFQGPFV